MTCRHRKPVVWEPVQRTVHDGELAAAGGAREMIAAAGILALAQYVGRCPGCGELREWSSDRPRNYRPRRTE